LDTGTILHNLAGYLILVVAALVVLATAGATMRAFRSTRAPWRPDRWGLAGTASFVLLDGGVLGAMALLGWYFSSLVVPLLFLAGLRLSLGLLWLMAGSLARRHSPEKNSLWGLAFFWALQVLVLAVVVDAFWIEPFALTTTTVELPSPGLVRPLRIVHISDLHVERTTPREEAVLAQVAALKADLIVLTGDYLNLGNLHDPIAVRETRAILAQLQAPLGVYAVSGTVDSPERMRLLFEGLPITVLDDQVVRLPPEQGGLYIVGVSNWYDRRDAEALQRLLARIPPGSYILLLYHTPDLIETASVGGVDLYLAGHTHGGQIRLPFYGAIVTNSRYGKDYEAGLYHVGPTTLYVSRGLGMEGFVFTPRVRLFCPPELVVLDLQPR